MKIIFIVISLLLSSVTWAADEKATDGIVTLKSDYSVEETADRFESIIQKKGLTLFNRIDHAKNAEVAGHTLRPTQLLIFGNPKW